MAKKKRVTRKRKKKPASPKRVVKDLKSILKSIGKLRKKRQVEQELLRYNRVLGEDYETLAQAKRAFKRETRTVSERAYRKSRKQISKELKKAEETRQRLHGPTEEDEWEEWAITFRYE